MSLEYRKEAPEILLDFLAYHETIKAHSQRTVDEYFLDMRNFLRYLKQIRFPDEFSDRKLNEISEIIPIVPLTFETEYRPAFGEKIFSLYWYRCNSGMAP